jgi:tetratricopeptide (TPR) repeat protein
MEKNLRLMNLMVVMFLIATIGTKAQKNQPALPPAPTITTSSVQDLDYDLSPDGILKWTVMYWPKLQLDNDLDRIKSTLATIINEIEILDLKSNINGNPKKVTILDNGIEVKIGRDLLTIDLSEVDLDMTMGIREGSSANASPVYKVSSKSNGSYVMANVNGRNVKTYFTQFKVQFNKDIIFFFDSQNLENAKKLADNLYTLQYKANEKRHKSELTSFEPLAASYRVLKLKPPVSEDQRRYIVQANAANKLKQFSKAIDLYNQAINVDATAYPAAYLNIALLSAQKHRLDIAIFNMKKFLMLEPESVDARSAQDKIYEWEGML